MLVETVAAASFVGDVVSVGVLFGFTASQVFLSDGVCCLSERGDPLPGYSRRPRRRISAVLWSAAAKLRLLSAASTQLRSHDDGTPKLRFTVSSRWALTRVRRQWKERDGEGSGSAGARGVHTTLIHALVPPNP